MVTDFLNQMVRKELHGTAVTAPVDADLKPVYFSDKTRIDPEDYYYKFTEISRSVWTLRGYTGFLTPWHDKDTANLLRYRRDNFRALFSDLEHADIDWESYCFLLFLMSPYEMWDRPTLLALQSSCFSWFKTLRAYVGSRENFNRLCEFVREFTHLAVSEGRSLVMPLARFVAPDTVNQKGRAAPKKYLALYHQVWDRMQSLESQGIKPLEWLRIKFAKCAEFKKTESVAFAMVLNINGFDPPLEFMRKVQNDPWREVRKFLGLSEHCKFRDNCVPKGWRPMLEDSGDLSKIVCITADGYYYREDGTQRRGRRHYAQNKYLNICCVPSNFEYFVKQWDDPRWVSAIPTWEEYSRWGLFPGLWDEAGKNISPYPNIKDLRWRSGGAKAPESF